MEKRLPLIIFFQLILIISISLCESDDAAIRGQVSRGDFTWNPQNFGGLYYDIKSDTGAETFNILLTDDDKVAGDLPYGLTYETAAAAKSFEFKDWGSYYVMGFMGKKYFTAYNIEQINSPMVDGTTDKNMLSSGQLMEVLTDDGTEITITSRTPLKLAEGYQLAIKSIDPEDNRVRLELTKDGVAIDNKIISPYGANAAISDSTYCYTKGMAGSARNVVIIAVHFKNALHSADQDLATVDGIWHISDRPISVKRGMTFDKMTVSAVDASAMAIIMDNRGNEITLSRNKDAAIMPGIRIRTSDNDTLRFYLYRQIDEPGRYELRGAVATSYFSWNSQNFAGFFYDINEDVGAEVITTKVTDDNKLSGSEPYGITYDSTAQPKGFKFRPWGIYYIVGFMTKGYFAAYNREDTYSPLASQTVDKNQMAFGQLLEILTDDSTERIIDSGMPLRLAQGYQLWIRSINADDGSVNLELTKDGQVVDSKAISPSADSATIADKTYCYVNPQVGRARDVVTIAVHFKSSHGGDGSDAEAVIDGIWQLSDTPTSIEAGMTYDKMTVSTVNADEMNFVMDNRGYVVALDKQVDISLMPGIWIRTAGTDMLRYYVYKPADCACAQSNESEAAYESGETAIKSPPTQNDSAEAATDESKVGDTYENMPVLQSESSLLEESRAVLDKAAKAIESEDKGGFIELISNDTLSNVEGEPDFSSPEARQLANSLREAKHVETRIDLIKGYVITYEMVIGDNTYSVAIIKEGGIWKISGL